MRPDTFGAHYARQLATGNGMTRKIRAPQKQIATT